MRDNLFRGKRTDNGKWVYGNYDSNLSGKLTYIRTPLEKWADVNMVDPETVGKYTGIFTTNEVEGGDTLCTFIYEGDIVEPVLTGGTHKGFSWGRQVVVFDRGAFCLKNRRGEITPMCNYAANVQFKVWGNIHDNPDFLEVTE